MKSDILSADLINCAKSRWELTDLSPIRNHQNAVFSCKIGEQRHLLRITDCKHRSYNDLKTELEWVLYLFENGVSVSKPILSNNEILIEQIQYNNQTFFASLFTWAKGKAVDISENFNGKILFDWGKELGKIHKLSINMKGRIKRRQFSENKMFNIDMSTLRSSSKAVYDSIDKINKWLRSLSKDNLNYGMIHGDAANFHIDADNLTFFDFDDCGNNWFAYDIANGLYSIYFDFEQNNKNFEFGNCLRKFLKGYKTEMGISELWKHRISNFIVYRIALLYQWIIVPENGPKWVRESNKEWNDYLLNWSAGKLTKGLNNIKLHTTKHKAH